jgi:gliding motility-associated-like protein
LILTISPTVTSTTTRTACNSFVWNGQTYTTSGTYTFNTQTAQGCDSVATLILTISPTVTSTTTRTACNSFVWNGQTYTISGTYTFNTQTAQGCDSIVTLVLTIIPNAPAPSLPQLAGPSTLCINPSNSIVSTSPGPGRFDWIIIPASAGTINDTTASADLDWNNSFTGLVKIVVRNKGNCDWSPTSDTLSLNINPRIPTSITGLDTAYCQSPNLISLQGNPAGGVFRINGLLNSNLNLNVPGRFRIKYELAGCYDSSESWVRVRPKLLTTFTGLDTLYCQNSQAVTLLGQPIGGTFQGTSVSGNVFNPNQVGVFTIRYFAGLCSDTSSKTVRVAPPPLAEIATDKDLFCQDTTLYQGVSMTPPGGTFFVNGFPQSGFRPNTPGINRLIYRARVGTCFSSDTLLIRVDGKTAVSLVSFGDNTLCGFDTLVPLYATPKGGFYNSPAVIDSSLNPRFLAPGNNRISYFFQNGDCLDSASIVYNILPVPLVNPGNRDTLCQGGPIFNLTGFSPSGGVWSGQNISGIGQFNPIRPGANQVFYRIPAQPGFSCAGKASKIIWVSPKPNLKLPIDTFVCEGKSIQLNAIYGQGISWRWQNGDQNSFILASEPGDYFVEVKDKFCTWQSDTFTLKGKIPLPVFSLGKDSNACFNKPVQLIGPSGMAKYEWTKADSNLVLGTDSILELADPEAIRLMVTSKQGCFYEDVKVVLEVFCEEVHIPEAFSPNGDGENEFWRIFGLSLEKLNVKVYNQWGECVYFSTDKEDKWDGKFKGSPCTPGAYQYIVEYTGVTPRGRRFDERKTGVVFLVK